MCKNLVHIVIFFMLPLAVWGNKVDSLQQAAKHHFIENNKPAQLEAYKQLGDAYAQQYQHSEALSHYQSALKLAQELKKPSHIFDILNEIGWMHFWMDDYQKALEILQNAQNFNNTKVHPKAKCTNYSRIAEVYIKLGIYDRALEQQLVGLKIAKQKNDLEGIANSHRVLSTIYWYRKEFKEAERELQLALKIFNAQKDEKKIYTCLAGLAAIYTETNNLDQALAYSKRSLAKANVLNYPYGKAFSTGMMGVVYKSQGKLSLAEAKLVEAIEQFRVLNIIHEATDFQLELADVRYKKGDYNSAISLLHDLDSIAQKISALPLQAEIHEALANSYSAAGDTIHAYLYQKKYTLLKDSLFSTEKLQYIAQLESRYKLTQETQEKEVLNKEGQLNKDRWYLFGYSLVLIICLVFLAIIYVNYQSLKVEKKKLSLSHEHITHSYQKLNNDHTEMRRLAGLLSREINDVVLSLRKRALQPQRVVVGYSESERELHSMENQDKAVTKLDQLLVGMQLYRTIEGDEIIESFALSDIIPIAIRHLPLNLKQKAKRIRLQNLPQLNARKTQITQLFEHLISNAIKFSKTQNPEILINCEEEKDTFLIKVQDHGIGIKNKHKEKVFELFYRASDKYEGSGIGLTLAKKIVNQHKGEIWLTSQKDKGTTVFIRLPK